MRYEHSIAMGPNTLRDCTSLQYGPIQAANVGRRSLASPSTTVPASECFLQVGFTTFIRN